MTKDARRIIKQMGTKYLCHPSNHVKRLPEPLPDIRRTFQRAIEQREQRARDEQEQAVKVKQIKVKR